MSKMLVINLTRITRQVDVRHADNKLDRVQIMARRRVELREGMTVDARWLSHNPNVVRVESIDTPTSVVATPVTASVSIGGDGPTPQAAIAPTPAPVAPVATPTLTPTSTSGA